MLKTFYQNKSRFNDNSSLCCKKCTRSVNQYLPYQISVNLNKILYFARIIDNILIRNEEDLLIKHHSNFLMENKTIIIQ